MILLLTLRRKTSTDLIWCQSFTTFMCIRLILVHCAENKTNQSVFWCPFASVPPHVWHCIYIVLILFQSPNLEFEDWHGTVHNLSRQTENKALLCSQNWRHHIIQHLSVKEKAWLFKDRGRWTRNLEVTDDQDNEEKCGDCSAVTEMRRWVRKLNWNVGVFLPVVMAVRAQESVCVEDTSAPAWQTVEGWHPSWMMETWTEVDNPI